MSHFREAMWAGRIVGIHTKSYRFVSGLVFNSREYLALAVSKEFSALAREVL